MYNLQLIKDIISECDISKYLITQNKEKKILGDLELPLGVCMDIMETKLMRKNISDYDIIRHNVNAYNNFIKIFIDGNYNNIELILKYIPDIVTELIKINI